MIPRDELENRINRLQAAMQKEGINGALLVQRADLFYFSGTGQNAHLFVPVEGEPLLIVKKSLIRAEEESPINKIVPFTGWDNLTALITESIGTSRVVGLENDVLPFALYKRYEKLLAGYKLVDISNEIRAIRAVKSAYELEIMRKAAKISKAVFERASEIIVPGLSEVELAGQLELTARILGHQGAVRMRGFNQELYFGHILAGSNASLVTFFDGPTGGSGLNPSYPQGAGQNRIKANEPVLVDFVSIAGGYMVDQTRIFSVGEPKPHLMTAYKEAVNIKKALIREGRPGTLGSALYATAADMAAQAGLANHFMGYTEKVRFVGHGVGLELDELPVIADGLEMPLQEGMVFALEPKFIFPGEGTVGIEDTFVVSCEQLEQLTLLDNQWTIL